MTPGRDELLLIRGYRGRGAPTNADEQELIPTVQRDGGSEAALQELGNKTNTRLSLSVKDFYERESVLVPHPADDAKRFPRPTDEQELVATEESLRGRQVAL